MMNEEEMTITESETENQTKPIKPKRTDTEKLRECYEKRNKLQEQKTAHRNKGQTIDKSISDNNAKIAELLKICREKMIFLSKKSGKNPAAYIREKAVSGKIMRLDLESMLMNASYDDNSACIDINSVAKNVKTEKTVYLKDVEEAEKGIELLEDYVHNQLRTPVFKEVTEAWL